MDNSGLNLNRCFDAAKRRAGRRCHGKKWRRVVAGAVALATALTLLLPRQAVPPAAAFKLGPHEQLVRNALAPFGVHNIDLVVGHWHTGTGNRGSDAYQFDEYRHFDNAPDAATVCQRATDAWNRFYGEMRSSIRPVDPPNYENFDSRSLSRTLDSFGALTHALQDFYAHSNYVELLVDQGRPVTTIEGLFPPPCNTSSWPIGLETGYFDLAHGYDGCPGLALLTPPPGYRYCHEELNKDNNESLEGRLQAPGLGGATYHEIAMRLAQSHTAKLYQQVIDTLRKDWAKDFPQIRSDCLTSKMFQEVAGPCRFGQLRLVNDAAPGVQLGSGSVTFLGVAGQELATYDVQAWPSPSIQTSLCLPGLKVRWDFAVSDRYPMSPPRRVQGSETLQGSGCDATAVVSPRSKLHYWVLFANADTVLPAYVNVIPVVNSQVLPSVGAVSAGNSRWIDLGPCANVLNFDFILQFHEPGSGILRTATPDSPQFSANTWCQDRLTFDLGGQVY